MMSEGYTWLRLDGSTPVEDRARIIRQYNKGDRLDNFVFLLSTRAGGTGLNLQSANKVQKKRVINILVLKTQKVFSANVHIYIHICVFFRQNLSRCVSKAMASENRFCLFCDDVNLAEIAVHEKHVDQRGSSECEAGWGVGFTSGLLVCYSITSYCLKVRTLMK